MIEFSVYAHIISSVNIQKLKDKHRPRYQSEVRTSESSVDGKSEDNNSQQGLLAETDQQQTSPTPDKQEDCPYQGLQ